MKISTFLSAVLLGCLCTCSCALRINQEASVDLLDDGGDSETTTVNVPVNQDVDPVEGAVLSFDEPSSNEPAAEQQAVYPVSSNNVCLRVLAEMDAEEQKRHVDDGFRYPTVPADPSEDDVFTTVRPVPDDFDVSQLENVNSTGGVVDGGVINRIVAGRASCACGVPQSHRIVGGDPARINQLPWTAALVRGGINSIGRPYCGATLINSRYVVTASHCVDGMSARGISVRLNQENVYASPQIQSYGVSRIIMHPNYNRGTIDHDIALVQLSQPVQLTRNSPVVPACLPASSNINIDNFSAIAAGWGATSQGGSTSSILRKVEVPIISNEKCNRETKYNGKITENMLCAGYMQGGKDSCQGDSGGPLIIQNGGRGTLIGIVSWGYGCAQAKAPGVYARVSRYPDWILANTRDADWCEG